MDLEAQARALIPLGVQRKLAEAGVSLSRDDWDALPIVARRRLEAFEVEDPMDRRAYGKLVRWLQQTFTAVVGTPSGDAPTCLAWRSAEAPPELASRLPRGWNLLDTDTRFALVRAIDDEVLLRALLEEVQREGRVT